MKFCPVGLTIWLVVFFLPPGQNLLAQSTPPFLRGYINAHDPSTMIQCKGRYYVFSTGQGILSHSSADKVFWSPGPAIFANPPAWTTNAVPGFTGIFWAPDILFFNNQYYLYYAVSTFGSQVSAIGLATNPTLDPSDPLYHWTDQGPAIQSDVGSPYNCIDPSFTWDSAGGLWMAFGSYWNGIYLVQLDPASGLRIASNSPTYRLAYNSSIEASYLFRRGNYYYLFANWGSCCSGVNSTYNIRVGRSTSITGPYLDRNGVDMANNGGTLFLQANGKFAGPGHVGILSEGGQQWLTYHYYDGNAWAPQYAAYGDSDFDFVPLSWTPDDWPVYTKNWSAIYNFDADASDANGQYYGLLQNGARILNDSVHGHILALNGTNQYVWLPPGVAYGQTFAAVVNWRGGAAWQRIFDFGFDTSKTVMLTAASSDNVLRCDINPSGNLQTVQWTRPLPTDVWTHVAVTLDGTQGILYVNGSPVATNAAMNLLPLNVAPQTNHLGRSKFTADPYFNGQYASFRVYSRALSPAEIAAPLPVINQPADGIMYWPGTTISFAGRAMDFADIPLAPSNLTWRVEYAVDNRTNVVLGPISGVAGSSFSIPTNVTVGTYRVVLAAKDVSNRQAVASTTLFPANPPTSRSSYYPLRTDVSDVNGHYNGTLNGGASFVADPVRGSVLNLSGSAQYVSFPPGIAGMQTFMAWVYWNGGSAWQRIFDFGNDTNHYTVLTPSAANGKLRFNISLFSIPGEQIIDAPAALPVGVWTHVALTMDGHSAVLYTNGVPVGTNFYANVVPANFNPTNNYLGKSNWPDPYFNGRLSSVRIFSRALAPSEIAAPQITISQPIQGALYAPGDTIGFAGAANDFYDNSIAATGLTWIVQFVNASTTNTVFGPTSGASGSFAIPTSGAAATNGCYQFLLSAVDAVGRKATKAVRIFPASQALGTNWASFYTFNSGAQDASNRFNGTLQGGASILSNATRGNVLNLSGGGQYVSLPAGAGNIQTISGWVYWRGGNAWQRIFDFGQNNNRWFFFTPRDSSGLAQCALTTDVAVYNRVVETPTAFPLNQWTHFAVVFDGRQCVLYLNGIAVAVNNSVNLLPSDIAPLNCWLGKSEYTADPYLNAQLDNLALNSSPLTLTQLLPGYFQPSLSISNTGSQIILAWPQTAAAMALYSGSNLLNGATWQLVTNQPTVGSSQVTLALPGTNSPQYYRLQWP